MPVLRAGCTLSWGVALNQSHFKTLIISTKASTWRCWLQFRSCFHTLQISFSPLSFCTLLKEMSFRRSGTDRAALCGGC